MHNDPVSMTPQEVVAKLRSFLTPMGESFDVAKQVATTNFELFCDPSDYEGRKVCTELRNTLSNKIDIARNDLAKLPDENAKDVYDLIRMYHGAMMSIRSVFYSYGDAVVKGLEKATLKHENEVSNLSKLVLEHEDKMSSLMGKVDKFKWLLDDSYSRYVPSM